MKRILVYSNERRKVSRTLPCLTSAGHMLVQWFKSFAVLHRSIEHLWKCPKYWFGVTNKFRWVDRFANTKSTNKEDWQYIQLGWGAYDSISAPSLLYNTQQVIYPLCLMASSSPSTELLLNLQDTWTTTSFMRIFQKPRLKMNCFFSTSSPFPWTPATCLSLCLRWWPHCWTTGQFYPTLTVLLGSSSSPFLVPLTATSCPP